MADNNIKIQKQIQAYRSSNPKLKNLSDEQVASVMIKSGALKLTEEQKRTLFPKKNTDTNKGTAVEKKNSGEKSVTLKSGRKIVIKNGQTHYYAADGVELNQKAFEKSEGKIEVKPSGRYSVAKNGQTKYYAANGTELKASYFNQVENPDVKIKSQDGKTYNFNKTLEKRINNVSANLKKAEDKNGFIGKMWSGFKNLTGIGDSSDKVREQQAQEKKLLAQFNSNPQNRAKIFEQLTGQKYTNENLEKFIKGQIKLKSEQKLAGYKEGQEMAVDIGADIVSGIAAVGIYSAAVAAAPFTGGASIAVGVAAAGVSGAAIKTGLKAADSATGGRKYTLKDAGHDAATGAFSGVIAPITGGMGGAVGKTVATKLGIQAVKTVGKEVAEEVVETGVKQGLKQGIKTALTNPTGYEYVGAKRGVAMAAEMASDGAVGGAVDNAFRTALDGGSVSDVAQAAGEGFVGGAIMSPLIGGGFKAVGKAGNKFGTTIRGGKDIAADAVETSVVKNADDVVPAPKPQEVKGFEQPRKPYEKPTIEMKSIELKDDIMSTPTPKAQGASSEVNIPKGKMAAPENLEDVLNDETLWSMGRFDYTMERDVIRSFYESKNFTQFKEANNYVCRTLDDLPEYLKLKLKEKGIDVDEINSVIKSDLDFNYKVNSPAQDSFKNLFTGFLSNNRSAKLDKKSVKEFLSTINPNMKDVDKIAEQLTKNYDSLLKSSEFINLSNEDKTIIKNTMLLNCIDSQYPKREAAQLLENVNLSLDAKKRILNLVEHKSIVQDLVNGKIDNKYASAVLRDKDDLNIVFMLAEKDIADKTKLNATKQNLIEHIDSNIADHGSIVLQTFIHPNRVKVDSESGAKYINATQDDVLLVHAVADKYAVDSMASIIKATNDPTEITYMSTSLVNKNSAVFNENIYGLVLNNRSKNVTTAGYEQFTAYNRNFVHDFVKHNSAPLSDRENFVFIKTHLANYLKNNGIELSDKEYVQLFDKLKGKQYFSQITEDIIVGDKVIKADVLRESLEQSNIDLAGKMLYGESSNNEVTSIVDGVRAIFARVDNIADVKPEVKAFAKENNLDIILLGKPTEFKNYHSNPEYIEGLNALKTQLANGEISGSDFYTKKNALIAKYIEIYKQNKKSLMARTTSQQEADKVAASKKPYTRP